MLVVICDVTGEQYPRLHSLSKLELQHRKAASQYYALCLQQYSAPAISKARRFFITT